MKRIITRCPEIKLIGMAVRTNNQSEMDPATAKIKPTMERFLGGNFSEKIKHRRRPGTIMAVYTNYEKDFTGDYTYFLGEEVTSFDSIPPQLESLVIPAQQYAIFTSEPGAMPSVIINLWKEIWQMEEKVLGGERAYQADFEIYDDRARDPQNTVVDVYIGIKSVLIDNVSLFPLLKAFRKFEMFRHQDKTEQEKAGIIQAFEYCFELSWKIMKRLLEERGKIANSPRETFRMAALEGFIKEPEVWFDFLGKRNITVYSYNQKEAEEVLSICPLFSQEIKRFLETVGIKE